MILYWFDWRKVILTLMIRHSNLKPKLNYFWDQTQLKIYKGEKVAYL